MLYADVDVLSCDRRRAEGEADNVDNGSDNKHVNGCVRGLHRADSGDKGWQRLWQDDDINNGKEESEDETYPPPCPKGQRTEFLELGCWSSPIGTAADT